MNDERTKQRLQQSDQLALPGVLARFFVPGPNLWYDEDWVYRLYYEQDDTGHVYRVFRENICTVKAYEGFCDE